MQNSGKFRNSAIVCALVATLWLGFFTYNWNTMVYVYTHDLAQSRLPLVIFSVFLGLGLWCAFESVVNLRKYVKIKALAEDRHP